MAKAKKTAKKKTPSTAKKASAKKATEKKEVKLNSDMDGMKKPQEYLEFIYFMAIPRTLRQELMDVETQDQFAKKIGVEPATLSDWKKRVGFWDDVLTVKKEFFKARTSDVILALETKNLNPDTVNGNDVRVLLTFTGEYSEKQEHEHKVHPELQAALEKMGKVLD